MNLNNNDFITIGNKDESDLIIIWFHGYGSNNWSFEPTLKVINMQMNEAAYIIMPNAPLVNDKRSWYPLPTKDENNQLLEDYQGLQASVNAMDNFIDGLNLDVDRKLIIGGFSQGAALALSMSFSSRHKICGCAALSGYMPCAKIYEKHDISVRDIFMSHGYEDKAIEYDAFQRSLKFLENKTDNIRTSIGSFGHTINQQVANDLALWFGQRIK